VVEKTVNILLKISNEIIDNKKHLTKLDSAIGDGDHGINLARGFKKVKEELEAGEFNSNGEVLKKVATTLISNVGGAAGPLYGTAFLKASQVIEDEITLENAVAVGEAAVEGVKQRGKAQLGDKTMLDVLIPVLNSLKESQAAGEDLKVALKSCLEAAEQGMKDTIPLVAKKGRASYLGERSKGHQDPGATSSYLMIKIIVESVC
jgi:dihydroxyacetone kinase-like protein